MKKACLVVVVPLVGICASQTAAAQTLDPCATTYRARPNGPLQVGNLDGNLAVPHRACPRTELALGGDFLLVADSAELYGNIRIDGRVRGSVSLLDDALEAFVSWEPIRYQAILSAVSSDYLGLGYLSFGVSGQLLAESGAVLAATSRFVAPTTTGLDQGSHPLALDLGLTAAYQATRTLRVHGWLTLLGSIGVGGPAEPRGGMRLGAGLDWAMAEWFAIVVEAVAGFGYDDPFNLFATQLGFRLAFNEEIGTELAVSLPIFAPRGLTTGALPLSASLMVNWRLPE
jgi:hypothetical protein